MIPAHFEYKRAMSVDDALALLSEYGWDAKLLAGGHSLLPLMKLRLASPSVLIDIGRLSDLSYVTEVDGEIRIGALTRHCDVVSAELLRERCPILPVATASVGDPQVRHRGTIGGSIVHGDPASDLPAVVLALDATLVVRGLGGERSIPAREFFLGFLETAIADDEILTEIRVPACPGEFGWEKFTRRAQDWAIVGVAVATRPDGVGIGLVNMGSTPLRATSSEAAITSGSSAADAGEAAADATAPTDDLNASAAYRSHLARVLTRRALISAGY
jgi:aerobic carbon-monoxide dehydrogenase medium subunit